MLLDTGVDLHSYQPTVDDIIKISDCDIFIYVGGESDAWVSDALGESSKPDRVVLSLMDLLGDDVKEEELVEGMEAEAEEEEAEEETEYDEHVWLSLRNARIFCAAITDALSALDGDCAEHYAANAAAYDEKLAALDGEFQALVQGAAYDTLLFGDRFPFRYLTDDYGLEYYAAFVGCSAETEASFETVAFLAEKLSEQSLPAVLILETGDPALAQTIRDTAGSDAEILTIDSMQGNSAAYTGGYLGVMESDLSVLKTALGWEG